MYDKKGSPYIRKTNQQKYTLCTSVKKHFRDVLENWFVSKVVIECVAKNSTHWRTWQCVPYSQLTVCAKYTYNVHYYRIYKEHRNLEIRKHVKTSCSGTKPFH